MEHVRVNFRSKISWQLQILISKFPARTTNIHFSLTSVEQATLHRENDSAWYAILSLWPAFNLALDHVNSVPARCLNRFNLHISLNLLLCFLDKEACIKAIILAIWDIHRADSTPIIVHLNILRKNIICLLLKGQKMRRRVKRKLNIGVRREELVAPRGTEWIEFLVVFVFQESFALDCIHLNLFGLVSTVPHQALHFFIFN